MGGMRGVWLDFFYGSVTAPWLFKANQTFDYHQTPLPQRLLMASYHMNGKALMWYQDAMEGWLFKDCETFSWALLVRFEPTAYDDLMEALTRLKQLASVSTYKAQFKSLINRFRGLSDSHKLSCFFNELKDEIQLPIRMLNPLNLNAAFGLTKIQEEYLEYKEDE